MAQATLLLLALAQQSTAGAEFRDRSVIGTWKLVSVLDLASIASLDEAEAKTMLGKFMTISATDVKVDQEVCAAPEFWAERVIPEPHMQEKLHSTAQRLRLPNPATMVELGCTDVYIRNPGQLVLLWGGAMFDAVRVDPDRRLLPASLPARKPRLGKMVHGQARKIGMVQLPLASQEAVMNRKPGKVQKAGTVEKPGKIRKARMNLGTGKVRKSATSSRPKARTGSAGTFTNELF